MTVEIFDEAVNAFRARNPFYPFIVELKSGERYEVDHRDALTIDPRGSGKAVYFGPGSIMRIFDNSSVLQVIDADHAQLRSTDRNAA